MNDTEPLSPLGKLPKDQLYLLADVGGTHARLELRSFDNQVMHRRDRKTISFKSLSDAISDFFSEYPINHSDILLCVSIAAKVQNNKVVAQSNIPWSMSDGAALQKEFSRLASSDFKKCHLLNDFEACAHSVPTLDPTSLTILKGEVPVCFENFSKYLLVGPGTGYGISMITKQ